MTLREWKPIARMLANCWGGDFTPEHAEDYFKLLAGYDTKLVEAAVVKLAQDAKPWVPRVPELIAAINSFAEPELPAWPEVMRGIDRGIRFQTEQASLDWITEHVHPVVAKFVVAEGWRTLRETAFYDPDYGPLRRKELKDRWESFVEVAKERLARGRALEAVTGRRGIGPARLDLAALIEDARPERAALPSGDGGTIPE